MSVGAVAAFAVTIHTGVPCWGSWQAWWRAWPCRFSSGSWLSRCRANQVASGLALSIFGVGLSAFVGKPYESQTLESVPPLKIPLLSKIPVLAMPCSSSRRWCMSPGSCCSRWPGSSIALAGVWCSAPWARLRSRPMPSATTCCASATWPPCSEGHGRHRGRLPVGLLHAFVGGGHGGRARLDLPGPGGLRHLAAPAGDVGRLPFWWGHDHPDVCPGFWLRLDIPAQFLSALPYLATVVVLVLISRNRSTIRLNSPASLGQPFMPDA